METERTITFSIQGSCYEQNVKTEVYNKTFYTNRMADVCDATSVSRLTKSLLLYYLLKFHPFFFPCYNKNNFLKACKLLSKIA